MSFICEAGKWYNVSTLENGDRFYYHNNKLHREIGPAIELADGGQVWCLYGEKVEAKSQKEFDAELIKIASKTQYYTVKIESMLPCVLTYKVLANSPEEAIQKARKLPPHDIKHRLPGKKDIKATVYEFGQSIVKLVMNLMGKQ